MNMIEATTSALKRYFDFKGRSRRSEYWYFYLSSIAIGLIAGVLDGLLGIADVQGNGPIGALVSLGILIPSIAVGVRRMHDIDKSGWWLLALIYNIFLLARNGDAGRNRFGSDPKGPADDVADNFT